MGMTNPSDATEKKNDHRGLTFLGTVSDNKDPMKLKRVRIKVPELIEGDGEDLPWAMPVTEDFEHVKVPEIGTVVYVQLQKGDKHYPIYFGSSTSNKQVIPSILGTNYPDRYGMRDSKNNYFFVDKMTGEVEFQHHSGTKINVDDSGKVVINAVSDLELHVAGTITSDAPTWNHTGDLNLIGNETVTGTITSIGEITGALIQLSHHQHNGVRNGNSLTGPPQNF